MSSSKLNIIRIAAIIAAYNESRRIQKVLDVVAQVDCLGEILVVDDGSFDGTGAIVSATTESDPRFRLITHSKNMGKGQAVLTGLESTDADILLLLDADLIALQPIHVNDLIHPVRQGQVDMTLGQFHGGPFLSDFSHWATPWLSGQRCLPSDLLRHVSRPAAAGYGLETAITVTAAIEKWKVRLVRLSGVSHPTGEFHRGLVRGVAVRGQMYGQIIRAWYLAGGAERLIPRFLLDEDRSPKTPSEKGYRRLTD